MVKKYLLFTPILLLLLLPTNVFATNYNFSVNGYEVLQGDNGVSWNTNITSVNSSIGTAGQITWNQNWTNGIKVYGIEGMPAGDNYTLTYQFIVNYGSVPDVYGDVSVFVGNGTTGQYACNVEMLSSNFGFSGTSLYSPIYYAECSHVYMQNSGNYLRIYVGQMTGSPRSITLPRRVNVFKDTSESIIQNNNSNTQDVIDNQSQNTQDVIDNQNSNTEQQIESQKVCKNYDKTSISIDNTYLASDGATYNSNYWGITDFIDVYNSTIEVLYESTATTTYMCFYNDSQQKISCSSLSSFTGNVTIPQGTRYIRVSINKVTNVPQFKICKNGNQALNDSVNDLNDSITSESTPNTSNSINDMNSSVASDTPISDLVTMPLTLMNAYINGISASCTSYNLGNLLGTNLVLPCINISNLIGSQLWSIIDVLVSIFLIFNISKLFISAFDSLTSLKDNFGDLYYHGKHEGGDN